MQVMSSVRKSISITEEQDRFLKQHSISLSRLAQKAIEQEQHDRRFAARTEAAIREIEAGKGIKMDLDEFMKKW